MTTTLQATACGKCGGLLAQEQIGKEIDVVCMNCGDRQVAVARVIVVRHAMVSLGLEGLPIEVQRGGLYHAPVERVCILCEKAFMTQRPNRRYCTPECKIGARKWKERTNPVKDCATCGTEFTAPHGNIIYCSDACNPVAARRNNA